MKAATVFARLFASVFFLLAGCSSTVTLKPAILDEPLPARIQKFIAVYHGREFLTDQRSADAYGNRHEFVFPVGAASGVLFLKAYPKVFQRWERLEPWKPGVAVMAPADAILEPQIESFQFPLQSLKGPYWAEVIYRFILYALDGKPIYSWRVKGWGESGDGSVYGEFGPIADAVEKAMGNAAEKFVRGFQEIPEVKRWILGNPVDSATASLARQRNRPAPEFGVNAHEGRYDGIVTVRARFSRLKEIDPGQYSGTKSAGLAGVRLLVRNESSSRIALDPSNFEFARVDGQTIDPIPGSFVAAALAARYGRLGPVAPGVGLAALPNLIFSLINAAADAAERKEIQTRLDAWRREELGETSLGKGASVEGWVFFPSPQPEPLSGELRVPVVELETAARYIVRIPLKDLR